MQISEIIKQVEDKPYSAFFYTPPYYKAAVSYLLKSASEIINIYGSDDLEVGLDAVQKHIDKNLTGYGVLDYEAGYLFSSKLIQLNKSSDPLIRFVFFEDEEVKKIKSEKIDLEFKKGNEFSVNSYKLNTTKSQFITGINKIKKRIAAGDTYQVNYTVKGKFDFKGSLSSLFSKLAFNQSAKYTSIINLRRQFVLSFSPELFFETNWKKIKTKPMKGTASRGIIPADDAIQKYDLENSKKDKAENVMIVDLLRNDLGRISQTGSVKVKKLFEVETYESVYQMVSSISSTLEKRSTMKSILKNIYPCGSITGAPKISTMQIINSLEKEQRGIYTGSIGLLTKEKAIFNVAIRTITIQKNSKKGELGLGSGVVWDSDPEKEFIETNLKSKFLTEPDEHFEIFETMLVRNGDVVFLKEHFQRMKAASGYFLFNFNEKRMRKEIRKVLSNIENQKKYKLKINLNKTGKIKTHLKEIVSDQSEIKIILSASRTNSQNKFQYFKTTNRKLYDQEFGFYHSKGFFDVIYLNERGELTEGTRTNIFINQGSMTITPSLRSGILPGIYRKYLLKQNTNIKERSVTIQDLISAEEIILTNSVRGEVKVDKLYLDQTEFMTF